MRYLVGQVGAAVDLALCDGDVSGHVDDVAEDLACLSVVVSAHGSGHQTVEATGEDEKCHVEVDLEADR
jgi:hypothetical protein